MSSRSRIEWPEATWNPTTGCDRISAGCDNCYALTLARRLKAIGSAKSVPYQWRVHVMFVNSMSDLFHARVSDWFIQNVFAVMAETRAAPNQVPSGPGGWCAYPLGCLGL